MKKYLLTALVLVFAAGSAVAQNPKGPGNPGSGGNKAGGGTNYSMGGGNPVDRMTEQLGLSEEQAIQIETIFETMQLLREEEQEKARLIACDLRASTHEQVMAVLDDVQKELFAEHQAQRQALREAIEEVQGERGNGRGRRAPQCDS